MKSVLLATLVFGFSGLAFAQEKVDPAGTWKCEYEVGGQKRSSTLTIKKSGETITGTMSWPDQKEANLKDLKFKEGELTFSAERLFMNMTFLVEYKLKISGDQLKGKGSSERNGTKQEFEILGKREK